jgi:hypothetical protein
VARFACKSAKVRCAELLQIPPTLMPGSQAALATSPLVMALAFRHRAAQETVARCLGAEALRRCVQIENEERCGGE